VFPAAKKPRSATKMPKSKRQFKSKRQKIIEKRVLYLVIIPPCLCPSSRLPRTHSLPCSSLVSRRRVVSRDVKVTILSLPSTRCVIFLFFFILLFSCHRHRYRAKSKIETCSSESVAASYVGLVGLSIATLSCSQSGPL
jgi:hypothetical protein